MNYWRITSPKTDLGDKMLYDPVLALNKINENSDHYTTMLYHLLNDYKNSHNGKEGLIMVSLTPSYSGTGGLRVLNLLNKLLKSLINIFHKLKE